jgi:hypothetical protein
MQSNLPARSLLLALALPFMLAAQTQDVSGSWVSDSDASVKWILDQKANEIHVREVAGDKVQADFTCPLSGKECVVKEDGHSEKIMMYFNGDKLVEIREHGSETIKQRLAVSSDGKMLTVETVPLASDQKAGQRSFRRQM